RRTPAVAGVRAGGPVRAVPDRAVLERGQQPERVGAGPAGPHDRRLRLGPEVPPAAVTPTRPSKTRTNRPPPARDRDAPGRSRTARSRSRRSRTPTTTGPTTAEARPRRPRHP